MLQRRLLCNLSKVRKISVIPQYLQVAEIVRKRVLHGDYSLKAFPSERKLAEDLGVNYMTVRHSLRILEEENLLVRQPNGRLSVKRGGGRGGKSHFNFAFVAPTFSSSTVEAWRFRIEELAASQPCSVRPVLYMHWDDPTLTDALEGFDGVFLNPIPESVPPAIVSILREPQHPVVIVDEDYSAFGIPSVQLFPPVFVQKLLNHLEACGHTKIGCLNTQPSCREIDQRINQWKDWMTARGYQGLLANYPVTPHTDAIGSAYRRMRKILSDKTRPETAWICITTPAAVGAMRAMQDLGIQPGKDVAICAVNGDYLASMLNPPVTSLEPMDPAPFISICLDWMMKGPKKWKGPLLMCPETVPLVIRESTQQGAGRGDMADEFD